MTEARLEATDGAAYIVHGDLDFASVPSLWMQLQGRLDGRDWELDLSAVRHVNSAALALLLEAHEETCRRGGRMRVKGLPDSLEQLAAMSGLSGLLQELRA
jgi:phospholipid transport system transporter-binding protein